MQNLVVLSGAGISAESGLKTFRDSDGLWEGYNVYDVATPEGWKKNRRLVLDFYNERRKQARHAQPNKAHLILAELQAHFNVQIITQNVDDLHERAGSKNVLHLHGELFKSRSSLDENLIYDIRGSDLYIGDLCEKGSQLRPHIVWFGEMVPMFEKACQLAEKADVFIVIGTSLQVYPAASLIHYVNHLVPKYIIDPHLNIQENIGKFTQIKSTATTGMESVKEMLLNNNLHLNQS